MAFFFWPIRVIFFFLTPCMPFHFSFILYVYIILTRFSFYFLPGGLNVVAVTLLPSSLCLCPSRYARVELPNSQSALRIGLRMINVLIFFDEAGSVCQRWLIDEFNKVIIFKQVVTIKLQWPFLRRFPPERRKKRMAQMLNSLLVARYFFPNFATDSLPTISH